MSAPIEEIKKKRKFRCLIHPNKRFKLWWDFFIMVFAIYNAIIFPLEAGYKFEPWFFLKLFNWIVDFCFIFDIVLTFRTIYFDSRTGEPVTKGYKIAVNYMFKGRFAIDIIASIPFEFLGLAFGF